MCRAQKVPSLALSAAVLDAEALMLQLLPKMTLVARLVQVQSQMHGVWWGGGGSGGPGRRRSELGTRRSEAKCVRAPSTFPEPMTKDKRYHHQNPQGASLVLRAICFSHAHGVLDE